MGMVCYTRLDEIPAKAKAEATPEPTIFCISKKEPKGSFFGPVEYPHDPPFAAMIWRLFFYRHVRRTKQK